jgi:hypothetical protein
VDAKAYPRTTSYLRRLPAGLLSHPQCESKASVYREAVRNLPRPLALEPLDPVLAEYVQDPLPMSAWVPEVVNTALYLAIADQVFDDDVAFLEWVSQFSQRVFEAPMYRLLMAVASPQRLATGGERRWSNFHTGVDYEIKVLEGGTQGRFEYPHYLYDNLAVRATLKAIEAAYRASGARDARADLLSCTVTRAEFRVLWYPERAGA